MRLDQYLVSHLNVESRNKAQLLIESNQVVRIEKDREIVLTKPSFEVTEIIAPFIKIKSIESLKYVSRAGFKLESALIHTNLSVQNKIVLDVGQSTGGFTDCLIQGGAGKVIGIDVGEGQLHPKLKSSSQVHFFEKINARYLSKETAFNLSVPAHGFDIVVCDVSFISILYILEEMMTYLKSGGYFLFLIKPQFECGPEHLNKNGIVTSDAVYNDIEKKVTEAIQKLSCQILDYFESAIEGKDGNKEFFIYGQKN